MKLLDVMWRRWSASLSPGQAAGLPVTLFRAQSPGLPDLGWSTFCRNLKVIEANGDHVSMLEYPYVQDIVDNLMNVLPIAAVVRVDATSSARRASEGKGVESFQPDP
jgi:thioesterase domain-containing protein